MPSRDVPYRVRRGDIDTCSPGLASQQQQNIKQFVDIGRCTHSAASVDSCRLTLRPGSSRRQGCDLVNACIEACLGMHAARSGIVTEGSTLCCSNVETVHSDRGTKLWRHDRDWSQQPGNATETMKLSWLTATLPDALPVHSMRFLDLEARKCKCYNRTFSARLGSTLFQMLSVPASFLQHHCLPVPICRRAAWLP